MRTRLDNSHHVVFGSGGGGAVGFTIIPAAANPLTASPKVAVQVNFTSSVNSSSITVLCKKNGVVVTGTPSFAPAGSANSFVITVALSGVSVGDTINVRVQTPNAFNARDCTAT